MKTMKHIVLATLLTAEFMAANLAMAAPAQLQNVKAATIQGGQTQLSLQFNAGVAIPKGFVMENPPRIVFDFPDVKVNPSTRQTNVQAGIVKRVVTAGSGQRTRVVVHLDQFVDYSAEMHGNNRLILRFASTGKVTRPAARLAKQPQYAVRSNHRSAVDVPELHVPADQARRHVPTARPIAVPYQPQKVRPSILNSEPAPRYVANAKPVAHSQAVSQSAHRQMAKGNAVTHQSAQQAAPKPYVRPHTNYRPHQPHRTARPVHYAAANTAAVPVRAASTSSRQLRNIDFRRTTSGGGRLILNLPRTDIDIKESRQGNVLVLNVPNVDVPSHLRHRMDVLDFATPVSSVNVAQRGNDAVISVVISADFVHRTQRNGSVYTLVVDKKANTSRADQQKGKKKKSFNGEKLSLNFQDIEVRAVLQLLADFTDKNIVVSDAVNGNITVRLKDVPWDQALDIVLETKNLGMRENGNVIWVAPAAELKEKEEREMAADKRKKELEPLITEYISINFAKASELAALIEKRSANANNQSSGRSLLSERGSVSLDERTNTLLVQDTARSVQQIRELIKILDIPVQQVLIESRIVIASDEFGKNLGARFGAGPRWDNADSSGVVGNINGSDAIAEGTKVSGNTLTVPYPSLNDRLSVNLPVAGAAGAFGFSILSRDFMLDLELSALQTENKGEIIATPRVITSNQKKAVIQQGVEVPFQQSSSSGATNVAFKKAALSLEVTPQITPDEHISMDLKVHQDTVGKVYAGVPSINTRQIQTNVLVENGQTIVLGGVHEETRIKGATKVPVLGDLPVVGQLFRSTNKSDEKRELLIFVTPKIVKDR